MINRDKPKKTAICDVCLESFGRKCTGDLDKIASCLSAMAFAACAAVYFADLGVMA